jgi:hypothetical protein
MAPNPMDRDLGGSLERLAEIAGITIAERNWPVVVINAVWAAKEANEAPRSDNGAALDEVEACLADVFGVETADRLTTEQFIDRLLSMRTSIKGGAALTFGPPGLVQLQSVLAGLSAPEERADIVKVVTTAVAINGEIAAAEAEAQS